jgi:hypothetical protein
MQPEIYFTQISNLSEARFATSVMAKGIGFCIEKSHPDYVSATELIGFKEWLVGSDWIAHITQEPTEETKEIISYFDIKFILFDNKLYPFKKDGSIFTEANSLKTLTPLKSIEDFEIAIKDKTSPVLLFGSKEEEVGMASMDKWLDYFEELEIL